jgi:hypothetical protein
MLMRICNTAVKVVWSQRSKLLDSTVLLFKLYLPCLCCVNPIFLYVSVDKVIVFGSVAEPHHFYAAPAPGKNFDAAPVVPAPAPALAPTL